MKTKQQQAADNRANQLNPSHPAYHLSRGASPEDAEVLASEAGLARNPAPGDGGAPQPPSKPSQK